MSNKQRKKPLLLVILDGFGAAPPSPANACSLAITPNLTTWKHEYPCTTLLASGTAVGLPKNSIGNSEVGHLTIGSGRIIEQDLVRVNKLLAHGIGDHPVIKKYFSELTRSGKTLHLMGLLSDAGVHSDINHIQAYLDAAHYYDIHKVMVHPFLDGRDVAPCSASIFLEKLETMLTQTDCIGSLTGRFYAMDRDNHWDRTQATYAMLTQPPTTQWTNWRDALAYYYAHNITDEFIPPTPLLHHQLVYPGDGMLFFNIRPDRARQLTTMFTIPLAFFITPVPYSTKAGTTTLLEKISVPHTLKEMLSAYDKTIFSIAETEKYAHVTYFFNGLKEEKIPHETQVLIPSLSMKSYATAPEMSAQKITNAVLHSLTTNPCDFYLINYANADMVGHSGKLQATIKAIEFLDTQIAQLYHQVIEIMNGTLIITADHGKAECMYDMRTQQPRTAHTTNPVPCLVINVALKNSHLPLSLTQLSDLAPYILQSMNIPVPHEMKT